METRDVTWESTVDVGVLSPQLPKISEPRGTDNFVSAQTTQLPVLEGILPSRAVSSDPNQGPRDGAEIREGLMRVETRTLNQEAAEGLVSLIKLDEGSRIVHAPLEGNAAGHELAKLPDRLTEEAEQIPTTAD